MRSDAGDGSAFSSTGAARAGEACIQIRVRSGDGPMEPMGEDLAGDDGPDGHPEGDGWRCRTRSGQGRGCGESGLPRPDAASLGSLRQRRRDGEELSGTAS